MIDYHCHILPGVDDGARTLDESLDMAKCLTEAGFTEVYCTPHCMKGVFDNRPEQVVEEVAHLQQKVNAADIALKLRVGMEYYLDEYFADELERLLPLEGTDMVLLEAPNSADSQTVKDLIYEVRRRRFTPLIAHPERTPVFQVNQPNGFFGKLSGFFTEKHSRDHWEKSLVSNLLGSGCKFQGNYGSFSGLYGTEIEKVADHFQRNGLYEVFGTDLHRQSQLGKMKI